jgi:hypothetical protein
MSLANGSSEIVKESVYTPHCLKISRNSKFAFRMLVHQLTCNCCPVFGMRMIIILACEESPMGLAMKSGK